MTLNPARLVVAALIAGTIAACAGGSPSPAVSTASSALVARPTVAPTVSAGSTSAVASATTRASAGASTLPDCVAAATLTLLTTVQNTSAKDDAIAFVKANKDALITGLQAYTPARESDHIYVTDIVFDLQKGYFEDATFRISNASGKWTFPVACEA